jgi:hypothetical protein
MMIAEVIGENGNGDVGGFDALLLNEVAVLCV